MQATKTTGLEVCFLYDETLGWCPRIIDTVRHRILYVGEYRSTFAEAVFHAGKAIEGGL